MARPMTGISLKNVRKVFPPDVAVVDGLDLEIQPGKFTVLIGPSGCGKTTILRMIGGLVDRGAGEITFSSGTPTTGFCFQEPRLLPWRSVRSNVGLPLELARASHSQRTQAVDEAMKLVGLSDASDRLPSALSGGMMMRTALARSLVMNPDLLLLDEPFGSLDEVTRFRLDEEVSSLVRERGVTVLLVTHSISEAVFLADEIVVLSSRPARIVDRFEVNFDVRDAELRMKPEFAELSGRVYESLLSGTEDAS